MVLLKFDKRKHKLVGEKNRKEIEKRLMILWRECVKERAGWKCEYCGATNRTLHVHHVFSRRNAGERYDVENSCCLCAGHHYLAHHDPETFRRFLIGKKGQQWYDTLYAKAHTATRFSVSDLLMQEHYLKKNLKILKERNYGK